jgi:hypothetical protein
MAQNGQPGDKGTDGRPSLAIVTETPLDDDHKLFMSMDLAASASVEKQVPLDVKGASRGVFRLIFAVSVGIR